MKNLIASIVIILMCSSNLYAVPSPQITHCRDHGGEISNKANNLGLSICSFPDGTECSGWAYLRGKCKPGMFTDWIDKNISKKTQFSFGPSSAGYISNRTPQKNITSFNQKKLLHYTKKDKAWFYYIQLIVSSSNSNAKNPISHPARIIMKKNGITLKTYPIKPIKKDESSIPIDIFIPVQEKGLYTFFLIPSGGDEVESKPAHFSFDNKITKKLTSKEIRAKSLAKWQKSQEKLKKQRDEKETKAKRKKYPIDSLPENCGFGDLYYGEIKRDNKLYYLVYMNRYSRIYDRLILTGFTDSKVIGKTVIFIGNRIIGGRASIGFSGKLGGRVFQIVKNDKINNLKKIKSLCARLQKQAEGKI